MRAWGRSGRWQGERAAYPDLEAAARLRLGPGFELAEGLGDLGEGVGDGLVPVHVRAAGVELPRALFAQRCRQARAELSNQPGRPGRVALGGALDDGGGIGPGGGKYARDHVEEEAGPDTVTASLEATDGAAANLERGGLVADGERDDSYPDEVDGALVAERRAEFAALAQAGA